MALKCIPFITLLLSEECHSFASRPFGGKKIASIEDEILLPEENPYIDPTQKSISGVTYGDVLLGLNELYPPEELSKRNAVSRTDGYWEYVKREKQPPKHFTYGEYDILFFAELLDKAYEYHQGFERDHDEKSGWDGKTFMDIGSGAGRLVIAAAALHPNLKSCIGVEILPSIHQLSLEKLEACSVLPENDFVNSDHFNEETNEEHPHVDELESNYYVEPLTSEMSEIQQALEAMTPEEWKELLGDDFESFTEDIDQDSYQDPDSIIQNVNDTKVDSKSQVEIARMTPIEISPGFVICSENELFHCMDKNEQSNILEDSSISFDSLNDFLSLNQEDWKVLVGEERKNDILDNSELNQISIESAVEKTESTSQDNYSKNYKLQYSGKEMPMASCKFICGSFQDPYLEVGEADVIFIFSSCMSSQMMEELSECVGRCRPGTIVITTEFPLKSNDIIKPLEEDDTMPFGEYSIEVMDTVTGFNWITKQSTAYIQRVTTSTWDGIVRKKPVQNASDIAWDLIKQLESKTLTDTEDFLRQVRNNMKFHSVSETMNMYLNTMEKESETNNTDDDTNADAAPL